ncbi:hypothetical protein Glove_437g46 [Diversispora epigaea]|uniref:DUF659 domain-containing protein n=1 Tax=Diversispora epigaea TaxID=1348612 RepID=A0A397GWH8_9GLOM|nr:hypothetical protein Glove_437g46 [Diversispora epigaea]
MGWSKIISPCSRAREFLEDLFVDNNKLFYKFCNISIGWQNKATITTHINSKVHKDSRRSYIAANRNDRQQSLHTTMVVADGRKQIIHDLVKAWVEADIPLEKINKLRDFFKKYCKEGGSIPLADSIRKHHLSGIFEQHYEQLREIFCVNNVTVGQLVLKTLVEWEIPFTYPYLIVSDSAAYMKKSVREILQPVMPQIRHNTYCAHIIQLISQAWTNIHHFDEIRKLILNIKKTMVYSKARRSRYMDYLRRYDIKDISTNSDNSLNSQNTQQLTLRFMPLPNTTRWNS